MKLVFLTTLFIAFLIGFGAAYSVPTGDALTLAERATPELKYFKVKAPSDDMGPTANAIAKAVDGLVPPLHSLLTGLVHLQPGHARLRLWRPFHGGNTRLLRWPNPHSILL
jgi:hypothetical protein